MPVAHLFHAMRWHLKSDMSAKQHEVVGVTLLAFERRRAVCAPRSVDWKARIVLWKNLVIPVACR